MKQVVAIIKPYLAQRVLEALRLAPLEALSVREVKGYGRQKSYLDQYGQNSEYSVAFLPKVEVTLWVAEARVEEVLRTIVGVARSGRMGDGKIFVLPTALGAAAIDIATAPFDESPAIPSSSAGPVAPPSASGSERSSVKSPRRSPSARVAKRPPAT